MAVPAISATGRIAARTTALPLPALPTVIIDSVEADVTFAGLVEAGLYQINVKVPQSLLDGDHVLIALLGAGETQLEIFITVATQ